MTISEIQDQIIEVFSREKADFIEAIATLFAVWNDALIEGRSPNDDEIVQEATTNWHDNKKLTGKPMLKGYLIWMRDLKLVPQGVGPRVKPVWSPGRFVFFHWK